MEALLIRQAADGTLANDVFARYLRIERHFVETSVRVRAAAALAAPTTAALDSHRRAMNSLLDKQHPYLSEAIERVGVAEDVPPYAWDQANMLSHYVLRIARTGDYAMILVVMLAAEELYATWCSLAIEEHAHRNPLLTEWIELHTRPPFTDEVADLVVGFESLHPSNSAIAELGACAAQVLDLEVTFHDSAYLAGK